MGQMIQRTFCVLKVMRELTLSDWTEGYRGDIGYSYSYFHELNPTRIKLILLNQGYDCPEINTACELGFGQGVSINIHSAASNTDWYGNDFIPEQAAFARQLAKASGANAHLYDDSFEQFAARTDLPSFDFIALHGVWSWISDTNRETIVRFIHERLNVGGVLYISYNTHPGWTLFSPVRHLLMQHTQVMGAKGMGVVNKIDGSLDFAMEFLKCKPKYTSIATSMSKKIEDMKGEDRHYLAHEYFNADWHISYFSEVAEKLAAAKLDFGCPAHLMDHMDAINLSTEQKAFLEKVPDPILKESARDIIVNQGFRRDLWVKGTQKLSTLEKFEKIRESRIVLSIPRSEVKLETRGALGEVNLKKEIYEPILDALANHEIVTVGELIQKLEKQEITAGALIEAVMVLTASGQVSPAREDDEINAALDTTRKLNADTIRRARSSSNINQLASPVTGGGVKANRLQQLFVLAMEAGQENQTQWVDYAWDILKRQGQRIIKEGKNLESDEANLQELKEQAEEFESKWLPVLKALKAL